MDCLYCGKKDIPEDWIYCGECGTNIKEYERAIEFIEKGQEFETKFEYRSASEEYKKALELNVPQDKILEHLERVAAKEQEVINTTEKAEDFFSHQQWKKAIEAYEKILKLNPSALLEVEHRLDKARHMLSKSRKRNRTWGLCIIIIVGAGIAGWLGYARSPAQVAKRTLKHAIVSENVKEKLAAIEAVGRLQDKTFIPFLKDGLKEPHPVIRAAIVKAFGQIKDPSTIPLLKECLSDKSWEVRIEAAQSLSLLGDSSGIEILREAIR